MKLSTFYLAGIVFLFTNILAWALPPENDLPEEVLATEIIVEGRSDLDNRSLSASDYAWQEEQQENSIYPPTVDSQLQHNLFLLRILKMLRTIVPIK